MAAWIGAPAHLRPLGLILILQIPIGMIGGTIAERRQRRTEAVSEVTKAWGGRQTLYGPFVIVPYLRRWAEKADSGAEMTVMREMECQRYVLPEKLTVDGQLATEVRRRGIFDVPLFVAGVALAGWFRLPAMDTFPPDTAAVHWERAELALGIADPRAIRDSSLMWREQAVPVRPGSGALDLMSTGVSAAVPIGDANPAGTSVPFTMSFTIAGSDGFLVLPAGSETTVRLRSPWPDPSFEGAYLPTGARRHPAGVSRRRGTSRSSRAGSPRDGSAATCRARYSTKRSSARPSCHRSTRTGRPIAR
jgi:inner membrane protein